MLQNTLSKKYWLDITINVYHLIISVSWELGISLAMQSVLGSLMEMSSEAMVIWSLTRTEGSVPRQLTQIAGKLVFTVGRASQFLSMSVSPHIACHPHDMVTGFLPKQVISDSKAEATLFYNLASKITHQLLPQCSVGHMSSSHSMWEVKTRAWKSGSEAH